MPFFRVALDEPGGEPAAPRGHLGETTLFSVGNAGSGPVLAHVVVWTDWARPVLGFYVHLGLDAVQSINLRDVMALDLPDALGDAEPGVFAGCVAAPTPGISAAQLRARLSGKLDPVDGLRYSSEREGNEAIGFVTVDVARDCDVIGGPGLTPLDDEYFGPDGVASSENVLWGDVFYVDPSGNSAQGSPAVAIPADAARAAGVGGFYPVASDRPRLPHGYRTRFMDGGPLATTTSYLMWLGSWSVETEVGIVYRFGPEKGPFVASGAPFLLPLPALSADVPLSTFGGALDLFPAFGVLSVTGYGLEGVATSDRQLVVWTVFRADGRFSAGLEATPEDPECTPQAGNIALTP